MKKINEIRIYERKIYERKMEVRMYKILLVEDDSAMRYIYKRMKTWVEQGFEIVAEASNGKTALELLEKQQFDIVVTDIRMPIVDGITLLKEIKKRKIDVFAILISSYNEFEYARQGLILGAFDYIVKPVKEEELAVVLERAKQYLEENKDSEDIDKIVEMAAKNCDFEIDATPLVRNVCVFLSKNLGNDITMENVAESLQYNKDYLGKSFKQEAGVTFKSFFTMVKMEYAKKLIATGNYKNYEIADKLGYSGADYFTKIFKEITGMTPAAYKKKLSE